eukprot:3683276-Rhodomonas_salina.1
MPEIIPSYERGGGLWLYAEGKLKRVEMTGESSDGACAIRTSRVQSVVHFLPQGCVFLRMASCFTRVSLSP